MAQKTTLSTLLTKAYALIGGAAVQAQIYFRERIALLLERRCPAKLIAPITRFEGFSNDSK
jgi:hypothetical protein